MSKNYTNEWIDLLRDESKLAEALQKEIGLAMVGKSFKDEQKIRTLIDDFAEAVAYDNGFDTEFVYDVEADTKIATNIDKEGKTVLVACKVNSVFLHEKAI